MVLDLENETAVRAAVARMQAKLRLEGLLVQQQVPRGLEAIVGSVTDPSLGALVLAGIGGTAVELYKDVSFRIAPITELDARDMLDGLKGRALLDGFRGAPPADRGALVDLLLRISALVDALPEVAELDLNPVMVQSPGEGCVVVDGRMFLRETVRPAEDRSC